MDGISELSRAREVEGLDKSGIQVSLRSATMDAELLPSAESEALRTALSELEKIDELLVARKKASGVSYFTPNHPQYRSLQSKARVLAYSGGNRSGKSEVGAFWLSSHLTRQYPACDCHGEWFAGRRYTRPIKAVIASTEFPIIERVIEPKLLKLLPTDWIKSLKRTPQGYLRRIEGKDGGTVDILSNEMDQLAFEGADWDLAWVDEPTQRTKWVAIQRGLLDREGIAFLTFTPIVEPWMKEEIIDRADGTFIEVVEADTYANTETIHGEPILSKTAIKQFESAIPEEERATRVHGQFFHLRGLVYKEFLPGVHSRQFDYQYPDPVFCVLDPHTRKPHWVIWAWVNRMDQLFVDRELIQEGTLRDLAQQILLTEQRAGYNVRRRLIDPNFGMTAMNVLSGRTVIEELRQPPFPLTFSEANDDVEAGIFQVKQRLTFKRDQPISLTNMPALYFHEDRARRTIHSLRNLQHEEWKGKTRGEKDPKETVKAKDDDGAACMRYLALSLPNFDRLMGRNLSTGLTEPAYA